VRRVETITLKTDTADLFAEAVAQAAAALRHGAVVALPTETVYGLAANALDESCVAKIFEAKDRPSENPIIVHVADETMARDCVAEWPAAAAALAKAFWPGPLTLVLPKAEGIPGNVTAGGDTVGVRWPGHPLMQEVIRACRFPLAAPSANVSNQVSPTTAAHVSAQLDGRIPLIIDGGAANVGIESTVVDVAGDAVRVLRPGMISAEAVTAVWSKGAGGSETGILKSPGQLPRHYAPNARLLVLTWTDVEDLEKQIAYSRTPHDRVCVIAHTSIMSATRFGRVSVFPNDPESYARALYAELHQCDAEGAELIVVEAVPEATEWQGIADRLARAGG
jgi:L-threonylcarbamoyladenylate synthase|tara:strand:+ start:103 stop:1110 length:1008 start_codon:yes stop_codon:yes gene_type:complete